MRMIFNVFDAHAMIIFTGNMILEATSKSMLVIPDVRPVFVSAETDSKKASKKLLPLK